MIKGTNMKTLTKRILSILVLVSIIAGATSCDYMDKLRGVDSSTDSTFEVGSETTDETGVVSPTINPDLEPLSFPDHIYTSDEIHPEHEPGDVSGQEALDLLDSLETDFIQYICSDYIKAVIYFDEPEAYGVSLDNPSWGDVISDPAEDNAFYQGIIDELLTINYEDLSGDDRVFYDKFLYDLEESIYVSSYNGFSYIMPFFNPLTGPQTEVTLILDVLSFDTIEDAQNYIALIADMDRYYADACAYEQMRAGYGYLASDSTYEEIAVSFDNLFAMEDDCFLYDSFEERLNNIEGITDEEKATLVEEHNDAMHDHFFPAFEQCAEFYRGLEGSGGSDLGLCNYEGGQAFFDVLFRSYANSERSVEEITSQLDSVLSNLMPYYSNLALQLYDGQNPTDNGIEYMNHDYSVGTMPENLDYLSEAVGADFPALPEHRYNYFDIPVEMQANFSPAAYLGYHLDRMDENLVINNPASVSIDLGLITAHEGYPGHMFQSVYTRGASDHIYMLLGASIGYVEGWATYVQEYSVQYFAEDNVARQIVAMNQNLNSLLLARVEIGIQYEGWSDQDCVDYLNSNFGGAISIDAVSEMLSLMYQVPGYFSKYAIGYMNTMTIMTEARNEFPEATDLEIHTAYLEALSGTFEQIQVRMFEILSEG